MESAFVDALPRIVEQRYESLSSLQSHQCPSSTCIGPDRFRRLEERLDLMQVDIQTSHKMLHDLSVLVHRQVQMTVARNKNRSLSDNSSPASFQMFAKGPPLGGLSGLNPLTFVSSGPEVADSTTAADPGRNQVEPMFTSTSTAPPGKKLSLPLAVPDATLSAQWLEKIEPNSNVTAKKKAHVPSKKWSPLPKRFQKIIPLSKAHPPTERGSYEDEPVSRRFSVSSINLVRSQTAAILLKQNRLDEPDRKQSGVSPEEIMTARNMEGEVHRLTLRHDSLYRAAWDFVVIAMILLDLVFTPLSLGFNYRSAFLDGYSILESVVFLADFFVRMFSSYVDEHGNLMSGPRTTATNYLVSGWALPDFLSWFPFEVFANPSHTDVLGFLKIFRLAKVSHLARQLHSARKAGIVRFLLLLGLVITIAHLLACYWSWVAIEWRANWEGGTFVPRSLFDEYTLCWSLVIGSVNASPPIMYTAIELISVACFMLVGNILQASVFGAVAALIASIDENEAAYSKKIITASERCRFLGIPDDLAQRIRGYYENLWRETKSVNTDADSFINELSPALICEVKFQLYRDMLKRIPFLSSKTLSPAVIEVLILHLRTVIYMQDDVLIRKGEFGDWMGFIGSKGCVGVIDPNSPIVKVLRILRKGDYFGEMALLQHTKRSATTVALTWVQIHVLCRQDLDYVKELYPTQSEILESEITKYKQMQLGIERC